MTEKKCYDKYTRGGYFVICRFCELEIDDFERDETPVCSLDAETYRSYPTPCKYHITSEELKELLDNLEK
mgnify:CR=1 FL=1